MCEQRGFGAIQVIKKSGSRAGPTLKNRSDQSDRYEVSIVSDSAQYSDFAAFRKGGFGPAAGFQWLTLPSESACKIPENCRLLRFSS